MRILVILWGVRRSEVRSCDAFHGNGALWIFPVLVRAILPKRLSDLERLRALTPGASAADARADWPPDRYRSRFEPWGNEDFLTNFAASLAFDGFGSRFSTVDPFKPPAREL